MWCFSHQRPYLTGQGPQNTSSSACLSQKGVIGMVAVDEAHLVHTWKNFRYVHYSLRCHLYRHSFEYLLTLKDGFHKMFTMSFSQEESDSASDPGTAAAGLY